MLCFSIVSLFMALTLASLGWFGSQMAASCQGYWEYYCEETSTSITTPLENSSTTTVLPFSFYWKSYNNNSSSGTPPSYPTYPTSFNFYSTSYKSNSSSETPPNYPTCADIAHGYCGKCCLSWLLQLSLDGVG